MYVVIFRATTRELDDEYPKLAKRMRELALNQFGCLEFLSVTEGSQEISLSYWRDEASIKAWKIHAEHMLAQELGRTRWYESYEVQIAEIRRKYAFPDSH